MSAGVRGLPAYAQPLTRLTAAPAVPGQHHPRQNQPKDAVGLANVCTDPTPETNVMSQRLAVTLSGMLAPSPYAAPLFEVSDRSPDSSGIDSDFIALQNALRSSGGLIGGDELACRLNRSDEAGHARLARWLVGRQAFSFAWHGSFWLPMFQIDRHDWSLCKGLRPVLNELLDVMDGWTLAHWFVQANGALQGRAPVDTWFAQPDEVLQAARLQRYVLTL